MMHETLREHDNPSSGAACGRRSFLKGALLTGVTAALAPSLLSGCRGVAHSTCGPAGTAGPTLEQKIAQMLLVGFSGAALDENSQIVRDIREHRIGGVILYDRVEAFTASDRNITSPDQVRKLTAALQSLAATPLFIAVDQEGGKVCRLSEQNGFPPTVAARSLGDRNDPLITRQRAESIAATLAEHGFNLNFAPVVDLNVNPGSPAIGALGRSFSADPAVVTSHARIFVEAHDRYHVATCLKHFPGHGSAAADSHLGFVDVTDTWSEQELVPYGTLIREGKCRMIMTAHVFNRHIDPDLPATLSRRFITGILRERLGYDGVVVTDDLQMEGLARFFDYRTVLEKSILAGADILLVSNHLHDDLEVVPATIGHVAALVRNGTVPEQRIDESYRRIMALKRALSGARTAEKARQPFT